MHPRDETAPRHRRSGGHRDRHRDRHRARRRVRHGAAVILAAVVLGAALTAVVLAVAGPRADPAHARSDRGGVGPGRGAALAQRSGGVGAHSDAGDRPRTSKSYGLDDGPTARARGAVVRAADVLRAWDERRAAAWAEGDATALRDLYVDRAGVADVRLLRRYADRGYRVEGLTTQLLAVEVLDRAPGRWRLRVTDRVTSAVAVRGEDRVRLPRDGADTHVVALARAPDGLWRVARTRAA